MAQAQVEHNYGKDGQNEIVLVAEIARVTIDPYANGQPAILLAFEIAGERVNQHAAQNEGPLDVTFVYNNRTFRVGVEPA